MTHFNENKHELAHIDRATKIVKGKTMWQYTTNREATKTVFKWSQHLSWTWVNIIQKSCGWQ